MRVCKSNSLKQTGITGPQQMLLMPTVSSLLYAEARFHAEWGCLAQIEYHYYHQTNITVPRQMLSVLKGLSARDLRVFNVEPNYWWHNYGQEFIEFAYIQVRWH